MKTFLLLAVLAIAVTNPADASAATSFGSSGVYSYHTQVRINQAWESGKRKLWTHLRSHLQYAKHYATLAYQYSPPGTYTRIYAQRALSNVRIAESMTTDVIRKNAWWSSPIDHYLKETGIHSARSGVEALRKR